MRRITSSSSPSLSPASPATIAPPVSRCSATSAKSRGGRDEVPAKITRSEEHTSELQSLMRISYAVFCLKKKNTMRITRSDTPQHHLNPDTSQKRIRCHIIYHHNHIHNK